MTQNVHAAIWRRPSSSTTSNSVEVAKLPGATAVRDSRQPDGSVLVFSTLEWSAFVAAIRNGEFGE